MLVLDRERWLRRQAAHEERVDAWIDPHLERRRHRVAHPVEDFLFTYYRERPIRLRRWHPGYGMGLADADAHLDYPGYREFQGGVASVEPLPAGRRAEFARTADLLRRTAGRPAFLGCFGLHEWAMVYRVPAGDIRHAGVPLRLPPTQIAGVVDTLPVRCSHIDAFRFFTDAARPLNRLAPTRASQPDLEQPGCLHANMDLYRYAYRGSPYVPSELVADCFALARDIRAVDMRASPYDLRSLGYPPIEIETPAGRADYAAFQRTFADRATPLRAAVLDWYERVLAAGSESVSSDAAVPVDKAGPVR